MYPSIDERLPAASGEGTSSSTGASLLHVAIAREDVPYPTHYLCGTPIRTIEAVADVGDASAAEPDCVVCAELERHV